MQGKITLLFDGATFGLYTANYENIGQILYTTTDWYFYHAADGSDGPGMDGSNYVHDEILAELWD